MRARSGSVRSIKAGDVVTRTAIGVLCDDSAWPVYVIIDRFCMYMRDLNEDDHFSEKLPSKARAGGKN